MHFALFFFCLFFVRLLYWWYRNDTVRTRYPLQKVVFFWFFKQCYISWPSSEAAQTCWARNRNRPSLRRPRMAAPSPLWCLKWSWWMRQLNCKALWRDRGNENCGNTGHHLRWWWSVIWVRVAQNLEKRSTVWLQSPAPFSSHILSSNTPAPPVGESWRCPEVSYGYLG